MFMEWDMYDRGNLEKRESLKVQKLLFREPPFILAGDYAEGTLLRDRNVCPTEGKTEIMGFSFVD